MLSRKYLIIPVEQLLSNGQLTTVQMWDKVCVTAVSRTFNICSCDLGCRRTISSCLRRGVTCTSAAEWREAAAAAPKPTHLSFTLVVLGPELYGDPG